MDTELSLRLELLYRWRSELASYQGRSFPGNGKSKITDEESEVSRLKKELAEMRMERDILKKAVNIFSLREMSDLPIGARCH